jgi:gas vesicle protein
MSTKKIIAGVLAGAAVGVIAGVLFAPDRGSNTRKKIKDKANGLKENLSSTVNKSLGAIKNGYEEVKEDLIKAENQLESELNRAKKV